MGAADLLLMQLRPDDPARGEATEIKQSVERGAGLTRQLLAFSRRQATRPRLFALGDVVARHGDDAAPADRPGDRVRDRRAAPSRFTVVADSGQIEQVVMNLVINARDAMPEGGRLTVRVDEVELDEAGGAGVRRRAARALRAARASADTGTGMDEQTRAQALRAVLHHQGTGQGHRPRPVDRLRHREAERRVHHRGERARPRRDVPDLPAQRRRAGAGGVDRVACPLLVGVERARRPRPRAPDQLVHHPPLRLGTLRKIALDRIADEPPLRPRTDDAERLQLRLDLPGSRMLSCG